MHWPLKGGLRGYFRKNDIHAQEKECVYIFGFADKAGEFPSTFENILTLRVLPLQYACGLNTAHPQPLLAWPT